MTEPAEIRDPGADPPAASAPPGAPGLRPAPADADAASERSHPLVAGAARAPDPAAARRFARRLAGGLALAALVPLALYAATRPFAVEREIWLARASGYTALGALFVALSVTPVRRLAARLAARRSARPPRPARWNAVRRSFGITAACLALGHGALVTATYLRGSWPVILDWPYLRAGLAAAVILAILLATSFPRLLAAAGIRLWKPLHRLAYVAAAFLFLHLMLSPFAPRRLTLALFAALGLVSLLRLLGERRPVRAPGSPPPLS